MDDDPLFEETISRFWVFTQRTVVHDDRLSLSLSPLPVGDHHVPVDAIDEVVRARYSPSTYGGWHWGVRRTLGGDIVYRLRGSEGVEVHCRDDTRIFIGTDAPDELHAAIDATTPE